MPKPHTPLLKRLLGFRFLFLANLAILVLIGLSFGREFVRNHEISQDIQALRAQAESLETRNLELKELNTAFQTESFLEREARLKLGMKKPGEQVVVVKRRAGEPEQAAGSEDAQAAGKDPRTILADNPGANIANPAKWWYYFFDQKRFNSL